MSDTVSIEIVAVRGNFVDIKVEGSDVTVNAALGDTLVLRGGGAFTLRHPRPDIGGDR